MSTYRDPVYRSIMAQSPFRYVEGTTHPVYDGYMVPVLPSPMLGGYTYREFTPISRGGMGGYTQHPFTPIQWGGMGAVPTTQAELDAIIAEMETIDNDIRSMNNQLVQLSDTFKPSLFAADYSDMFDYYKGCINALYDQFVATLNGWKNVGGDIDPNTTNYYHEKFKAAQIGHKLLLDEVKTVAADPKKYAGIFKQTTSWQRLFGEMAPQVGKGAADFVGEIGRGIGSLFGGIFSSPVMWVGAGLAVYLLFFRKRTA